MYRYQSKQISFTDFDMPLGMKLDPGNRWVKKASSIPWEAIEKRYAANFEGIKGNVAKPLRLALGALIIQTERRISDEEVALQIQETPCLQYFCGFAGYTESLPFDSSSMVHFRKRLTPEMLGEINEMIIAKAAKSGPPSDSDDGSGPPPSNEGDLIVDATCAPQNIRHPQDISLLNEARENLESMIDVLHRPCDGGKPRAYRRKARHDYLEIAMSKKKTAEKIRKAIGRQLNYVRRDLGIVSAYLGSGRELPEKQMERLSAVSKLFEQQLYMHSNNVSRVENRIVSLGQPWVRPIVRGKANAKCEFGAKLDISVSGDGFARLERTSFDAYNEGGNLMEIIERHKERAGHYPDRVLVDKIYRTRANLIYCGERGIRIIGKPLGRPGKDKAFDRKQARKDEIDRIEVERKFSLAKGSFGLGLIRTKLKETSETAIALAILALNIAFSTRFFRALFEKLIRNAKILFKYKNFAFVQ